MNNNSRFVFGLPAAKDPCNQAIVSAAHTVCAGASKVVGHAANWVERYSSAAAGLVVAASFWSVLHPPSYHLLRCIAAALPVWAGYAETSRACASGRVPDGPPVSSNQNYLSSFHP